MKQIKQIDSKKGKGKKLMKIIFAIVILLLLIAGIILLYKMNQLNKVIHMSSKEMIAADTKEKGIYVAVAIIDNGEVTYHTYSQNGEDLGCVDYEYEIGSISKTMAALLVAKAVKEGKIDLHAPISDYLDLPQDKYYPTIDRLLTHTSGYKNYYFESEMISNHLKGQNDFYRIDKNQILDKVRSISLEDKDYPFVYSNFGLSVIGLVLESVYQKDYTELLTECLQNELNMNDSSVATCDGNLGKCWKWDQNDGYIPAGAVISNIKDMATYLQFCMKRDNQYADLLFKPLKKVNAGIQIYDKMGIQLDELCMTWIYDNENDLIWHNGGTSDYNSYIGMNKERTKGVVMLTNCGPYKNIPVTVIGPKILKEMEEK